MIEGIRGGVGENQRDIPFSLYLYNNSNVHDTDGPGRSSRSHPHRTRHPGLPWAEMAVGDDNQPWPATAIRARPERIIVG